MVQITPPIHLEMYGPFQQGPFEPTDLSESSPPKLYILCLKYVVKNIIKFNFECRIPSEISDNLIEAFRQFSANKLSTRFLYMLSHRRAPVVHANLSGLEVTNDELIDFVDAHSRTLRVLNISNCNRVSSDILKMINTSLMKVHNPKKLYRMVTVYEVPIQNCYMDIFQLESSGYNFVLRKLYHDGQFITEINSDYDTASAESHQKNSLFLQCETKQYFANNVNVNPFVSFMEMPDPTIQCGSIPKTDFELHKAMGMFDDPEFLSQYFQQQPYAIATYDHIMDNLRHFGPHNTTNLYEYIHTDQVKRAPVKSLFIDETSNNRCFYCNLSTQKKRLLILPKRQYHLYLKNDLSNLANCDQANGTNCKYLKMGKLVEKQKTDQANSKGVMDDQYFLKYADKCALNSLLRVQINNEKMFTRDCIGQSSNEIDMDTNDDQNVSESNSRSSANQTNEDLETLRERVTERLAAASHEIERIRFSIKALQNTEEKSRKATDELERLIKRDDSKRLSLKSRKDTEGSGSISNASSSSSCPSLVSFGSIQAPGGSESAKKKLFRSPAFKVVHPINESFVRPATADASTSTDDIFPDNSELRFDVPANIEDFDEDLQMFSKFPTAPETCAKHETSKLSNADLYLSQTIFDDSKFELKSDLKPEEESLRIQFFPHEVYRLYSPDYKYVRIVEVRTWSETPLESLVVNRSSKPQNVHAMSADQRTSLFFNTQMANLKRLTIHDWHLDIPGYFMQNIPFFTAQRLTYLDLSNCASIGDGTALQQFQNLQTLILYNVAKLWEALAAISQITTLRTLDISSSSESQDYDEPEMNLAFLVESLPNLIALDISGTNLAGFRSERIKGLESRQTNKLQFLGIFQTRTEASNRSNIPAIKIAGEFYEEYVLNSCEVYMNRVEMLQKCLNELFKSYRYEAYPHDLERSLKILVSALGRHPNDKSIQIAASATLFYIVKHDDAKPKLGRQIKELIVTRLLDAMHTFRYDQTMLRNGCLNLIHFRIPADVISEYTRLTDILLYIVTNEEDDFVQRLGIYLLNSLACQVDGEQKTIVGNLGAIEKMLHLIELRFNRNVCDEVMETAWSTMWNVTDETPINCERFLNNNGMEFFVSCMEKFPEYPDLLRNMMGLLGNVSECAHLRYRLMKEDYIIRFIRLLNSQSDGIEVSYNSAGILAHIASDGAVVWNRYLHPKCNRDDMLNRMEEAISRWEINSKRNINYRSFEPILRLLRVLSISWQAQYWAVWALANLTRVHCSKYCPLLEKDGGIDTLKSFITAPRPDNYSMPTSVKCLAVVTLFQFYLYTNLGHIKRIDKSNQIPCFDVVDPEVVMHFLQQYSLTNLSPELCFHLRISHLFHENVPCFTSSELQKMDQDSSDECDYSNYDEVDMAL